MYAIAKVKNQYAGIPPTLPEIITKGNGEIAVWKGSKSARAWIDEHTSGVYGLANDEYADPTYYVLPFQDAECIRKYQAQANEMADQARAYVASRAVLF